MAVETRKRKRKTHVTLLVYIMTMLGGSSVWLKLMLKGGTRSGHPLKAPQWQRLWDNFYIVAPDDFTMDVDLDNCEFKDKNPGGSLAEQNQCGLSDAAVHVTATIERTTRNMDGLYLTLHAAKDFDQCVTPVHSST